MGLLIEKDKAVVTVVKTKAEGWRDFRRPLTGRAVQLALLLGFGMVMLLLGAAGLVSVREGRAIRSSAAELVREQILITRLLHEAQVEEDSLALALHRLARTIDVTEKDEALRALESADRAIARLAVEAETTPQASDWRELQLATQQFTRAVRSRLNESREETKAEQGLDGLFDQHDVVVKLIHELILRSTEHLAMVDEKLGAQLQTMAEESAVLLGSCFVLAAVCAVGTIAYVRQSIERMESQSREISDVSWHMLQNQEEAARRFSHELHDELGQSLAAVRANLTRKNPVDVDALRADSLHLVDEAIANVRELSQLLRPVILDDFGLAAGLRWLTEKFAQRTHIAVSFVSQVEQRLHSDLETHLFRIAQEALTNIARHSGASQVSIAMEAAGDKLLLVIEDNGRGLLTEGTMNRPSLGLIGMRARARECGGGLELSRGGDSGLRITVVVPLRFLELAGETPVESA